MEYKLTKNIGSKSEEISFRMPSDWSELTFKQLRTVYELILNQDYDDLKLISTLTNLDINLLRLCEADEGYIKLKLDLADFTDNLPDLNNLPLPETVKIGGQLYVITKDLGLMSIEILEYCRIKLLQYNQIENQTVVDLLDLMHKIYTHYAYYIVNKKYSTIDVNLNKGFQETISNCLWTDIVSFGGFFLRKSRGLMSGISKTSSLRRTPKTKLKLALLGLMNVGALRLLLKNFLDIMLFRKKS